MALTAAISHRRHFLSPPPRPNPIQELRYVVLLFIRRPSRGDRWLGTRAEAAHPEFSGADNAYDVLGVSETCSPDEIKSSFRKLAKETHPDLVSPSQDVSKRFVDILAAYEILSDPTKRAHFDQYLLTSRLVEQQHLRHSSSYQVYATYATTAKQMEVVEWLKWYRAAVKDILSERSLPAGNGYFEVLQRELFSALHSAYFGPEIESLDFLPDRFEAEERSVCDTPEVLHLVSGRDLFGMVRIADDIPELADVSYKKLTPTGADSDLCQHVDNLGCGSNFASESGKNVEEIKYRAADAYKDLELHVCGRLVAVATRVPPKESSSVTDDALSHDQINVYLSSHEKLVNINRWSSKRSSSHGSLSKILLGKITGLGTNPDESSCFVYDSSGTKTHVILKHRTPLVKHLHWFQLGDEASVCECRCTRARLPPSKFWLFEPRCSMHDIGGWYVETYGRDKKNKNVPSQRSWDGVNAHKLFEKRLHPAVYLLALAYRTLDIETGRTKKRPIREIAGGNLFRFFGWCKRLI